MAESDQAVQQSVETELDRELGFWGAVAIGVGTMIAAGIFVLSGLAVSNVGALAIVSFLLAAIVASFTAFAYAEFASIYPESGGGYMYVANVYDSDLTYIVGWSMILGYPASAAFYLASFSDWFTRFIQPAMSIPAGVPYWLSGLVILGLLVAVNMKGTEETGMFQIVVTALKVALIVLFLYGGLQAFDLSAIRSSIDENIVGVLETSRDIGITSALVFITFFGFEAIATNAEEIEDPGSTVPKAIFFSMGFVTLIYTLVVIVVVLAVQNPDFLSFLAERVNLGGLTPTEFVAENGEVSMGRAAQYYLGDFGFYVIIVGALFSMLSAANATIMAGSRVKLAMARRDHLPRQFEDLHPTLNTPYKAVLLTGGFIFLFILVFTIWFGSVPGEGGHGGGGLLHLGIEGLAHFADFMLLVGLIFVNLAIIRSRRDDPDVERGFEVPGVPWVPIVAVLANLALLVNVTPTSFALGVLAQFAGVAFWFAWKTSPPSEEEIEREMPTAVAEYRGAGEGHRVLVPIANPEHIEQLMDTAIRLARDRDAEILVMSVVTLPVQTPLSRGHRYTDERRPLLDEAMAYAEEHDVPASGLIRISHHAGDAIVHTMDQHDCDTVLVGWRGTRHRRRDIVLGTTVDRVVTAAKGEVLVEKIREEGRREPESILLPTAGGPHAELAGRIAASVARATGASIEVVSVVEPDSTVRERERVEELLDDAVDQLEDVEASIRVLEDFDVADAIVDASRDHDTVVLGATREGALQQLVFGDIPHEVGERAETNVIMAKENTEIDRRLARMRRFFNVERFGERVKGWLSRIGLG